MNKDVKENLIDKVFFKKYRCLEYIGEGSFSQIFKVEYNNNFYAIKLENINNKQNLLSNEASMMIYLKGPNIPYIVTYGSSGGYNLIVMQLLGKNLQQIFEINGNFSIKTVCLLAIQMISILEHIHNKGVIHRDIKPENFVLGKENERNSKHLYLIDFGFSKFFDKNGLNDIVTDKKNLIGTPRYASINALRGIEQSMRDDLESVGYILVYLLKGKLPWMGIKCMDKNEKIKKICIRKIETSSSDLCVGLPKEFVEYFDYCNDLEYEQKPDYTFLKNLFFKVLRIEKEKFDYIYDWDENDKSKKKIIKNALFYSKSTEIADININYTTVEDNRPIGGKSTYNNELNEKNVNEENKDESKDNNKNKVEQPTTCCIIL